MDRRNSKAQKSIQTAPGEHEFELLSMTFQALSDTTRLRVLWTITQGEKSVSNICKAVEASQPAVSHHLRTLRNLRLVRTRKDGRTIFYRLDDEHIENLLKEGMSHVLDLLA